jgi:hypothetical protein
MFVCRLRPCHKLSLGYAAQRYQTTMARCVVFGKTGTPNDVVR